MEPTQALEAVELTSKAIGVDALGMLRFVAAAGWLFALTGWVLFIRSNGARLEDAKESGKTAATIVTTLSGMRATLDGVAEVRGLVAQLLERRKRTTSPGLKPPGAP